MAHSTAFGMLLMVLAGLASSCLSVVSKVAEGKEMAVHFVLAVSCFVADGWLVVMLWVTRAAMPERRHAVPLAIRGTMTAANALLMLAAVFVGTPIGDVLACMGISGVLAALLGRLILKEQLRWAVAVPALLLSLTGATLIARPSFLFGGSLPAKAYLGYGLALLSGACQATLFVTARKLRDLSFLFQSVSSYTCLVPGSLLLACLLGESQQVADYQGSVGAVVLLVAVVVVILIFLGPLQSRGAQLCPAALSATAALSSRVIFGYMFDVTVFGTAVRWTSILGGALMVLSSAMMILAKPAEQPSLRKSVSENEEDSAAGAAKAAKADAEAPKEANELNVLGIV